MPEQSPQATTKARRRPQRAASRLGSGQSLTPPITIRRPRADDAAAMVAIMGDTEVLPGLLQVPYPTEAFWKKRIEDMAVGPTTAELFVVAERGGVVVGNAGVNPMVPVRRRHVAGIGMAVAREAQGLGVGSALMTALLDWSDNWAQLLRLELTVFTDNAAGIALYCKFGFEHEGTHRAYALRNGAYADVHCMARLHPRPPALPG